MRVFRSNGDERHTERTRQLPEGARPRLSENRLQLRPSVLDWIEVGRIARKVDEPRTAGFDELANARRLMRTEPVEGDNVTGLQLRGKALLGIGFERSGGHCAAQHHRRGDPVESQSGRHGDVVAPVLRRRVYRALPRERARVHRRHREVDARFVDKEEASRPPDDVAPEESQAFLLDLWPVGLTGVDGLFLRVNPSSMRRRETVETLTRNRQRCARRSPSSRSVASGFFATNTQSSASCASVRSRSLPGGDPGRRWPRASRRIRILRTQLSLTPRISAASPLLAPSSKRATARSRKSMEYGLIMGVAVNTQCPGQTAVFVPSHGEPL